MEAAGPGVNGKAQNKDLSPLAVCDVQIESFSHSTGVPAGLFKALLR
jgi:hypothetical protein